MSLLMLFVLAALATLPGWRPGRVLAPPPDGAWIAPSVMQAARDLRHGRMPLWNPYENAGEALAGNGQVGVFYPTILLHMFLPPRVAWGLAGVAVLFAAGAGTWLLARRFGVGPSGRLLAGAAFMLCAYKLAGPNRPEACAVALAPWVLLTAARLTQRISAGRILGAAVAFAIAFLAGQPQITTVLLLAAIALWLVSIPLMGLRDADGARHLGPTMLAGPAIVLAAAIGMLVAGVQWITQMEYMQQAGHNSWSAIVGPIMHMARRNVAQTLKFAGSWWQTGAPAAGWVGAIAAMLAVVAFLRGICERRVLLWTALALLAFAAAVVFRWTGSPAMFVVGGLAIAMLGGIGLDHLQAAVGAGRLRGAAASATIGAVAVLGIAGYIAFSSRLSSLRPVAPMAGALLALGLVWMTSRRATSSGGMVAFGLPLLAAAELLAFGLPAMRTSPRSVFQPASPAIDFIRKQQERSANAPFRIASLDGTLAPGQATILGIPTVNVTSKPDDPALRLTSLRYTLASAKTPAPGDNWRQVFPQAAGPASDVVVYERTDWLPRAWIAKRSPAGTSMPAAAQQPGFDPRETTAGRLHWKEDFSNRITLDLPNDLSGWLVLGDRYALGWRATLRCRVPNDPTRVRRYRLVDIEVPVMPAHGVARTIAISPSALPRGAQDAELILDYLPRGFTYGVAASLGGAVLLLILGGWSLLQRRA